MREQDFSSLTFQSVLQEDSGELVSSQLDCSFASRSFNNLIDCDPVVNSSLLQYQLDGSQSAVRTPHAEELGNATVRRVMLWCA